MDYRKTLNLPQTKFPMKANLPQKEPELLKSWEEDKVYQRLKEQSRGQTKFILHDGPPYPNGNVHLGTAFNKVLKDIIVKYKSTRGFFSPYVPGWDCHGMPIEHLVVENLGKDKDKYSQAEIRRYCRDYALKYVDLQREQFKRLGIFGDWEDPYLTLSPQYEAKIIEVFAELLKRGYIYRGLRPIYWCFKCQTALAEAEIEYKEVESPSIYVKFPLKEKESKNYFLIWTTTPWTLPANVAIALNPSFEYAKVRINPVRNLRNPGKPLTSNGVNSQEVLIMAKDLVNVTMEKVGIDSYKILQTFKGKEAEGLKCSHPFLDREVIVILADYVTAETGTGCVHIAPGHGQEDYLSSLKYNLKILSPIDEKGNFTAEAGEFSGLNVFSANKEISKKLKSLGHLLYEELIIHSYPHCWRCGKPIIFRAARQWFFNLEHNNLREKILSAISSVEWIPGWGEEKMFNLIKSRPDWCISRQRSWGVPVPIFYCKSCGEALLNPEIIEKVRMRTEKEGIDFWFSKEAKEILPPKIKCPKCQGEDFRKETDILDVWFESGVSYAAVLENREDLGFPADIYLEAIDQHRGWFQAAIWPSMALKGLPPYKGVLTHGLILDKEGKKMSKSQGNVIAPEELINKYGGDILRLWFASVDYTCDVRLSDKILEPIVDNYRKIRNTCRYILGNLYDFNPKESLPYAELEELDRWALLRLHQLIEKVTSLYEKFEFHSVCQTIHNFCNLDLSSFYLDVLKDRLYTEGANSLSRRSAQTALYEILVTLDKLIFPILSFTAQEVWQHLPSAEDELTNLQLFSWPKVKTNYLDLELEKRWSRLLIIRSEVAKALEIARNQKIIGQPLEARVEVYVQGELFSFLSSFGQELKTIFITSDVEVHNKEIPKEAYSEGEVGVIIKKARGEKCARCWNYEDSVGKNNKHPSLCERCVRVVEQ